MENQIRAALKAAMAGENLGEETMAMAIGGIMDDAVDPLLISALLVALRIKGESAEEIAGAARAMRERMQKIEIDSKPLVDTCGTGGSGKGLFNISTTVAFVVAAGGAKVAKHGNRAVSSRSGSADVLQALGVNIACSPMTMAKCVQEVGVGFLFAPTLHPAMRHAGPIRKALGMRTIFNVLGPLTNPAGATRQLLGVFDGALTHTLATVLGTLGSEKAWVVHGDDGADELTVCAESQVSAWDGYTLKKLTIAPEDYGIQRAAPESLQGQGPEENAKVLRAILAGEHQGPLQDAVRLNAGAALMLADKAQDLKDGIALATEILQQGKAAKVLEDLVVVSQE